jgi:hypothetical protein
MSLVSRMVCISWRFFHEEHHINIILCCYEWDWTHSEWDLKVFRLLSSQGVDILLCSIVKYLSQPNNSSPVTKLELNGIVIKNSVCTLQKIQGVSWCSLWFPMINIFNPGVHYEMPCTMLSWHWPARYCCLSLFFVHIITIHVKCIVWVSAELWMLNLVTHIGTMCSAKLNTPREHSVT